MGADASVYAQFKPADLAEGYARGMDMKESKLRMSEIARQRQHSDFMHGELEKKAKLESHKNRVNVVGQAMESLAGMSPEQRAATYPKVRAGLLQKGLIDPNDSPDMYDDGWFTQSLSEFRSTPEYLSQEKTKAEIDRLKAETVKAGREARGPNTKTLEVGSNLRKEWTGLPTTKATQDVAQSLERVRNAYSNPSAAGDLTLIYSFMKMNDPGSTVREGEFATAQNAAGVPERIRNEWNRVLNGERLSEAQRTDFASQAEKMYGGQLNAQKTVDQQYAALAKQYGVDPSVVMMKFPDPKELKLAAKQEEKQPGWLESVFGSGNKTAHASQAPKRNQQVDFNAMTDAELEAQFGHLVPKGK